MPGPVLNAFLTSTDSIFPTNHQSSYYYYFQHTRELFEALNGKWKSCSWSLPHMVADVIDGHWASGQQGLGFVSGSWTI